MIDQNLDIVDLFVDDDEMTIHGKAMLRKTRFRGC